MNSLTFELRNVRRTALVLSLILPIGTLMAQGGETPRVLDTKVVESPVFKVEKLATVRFSDLKDDWNPVLKTIRTVQTPGVNARKDELIRLKAEANAERDRYLATLPGAAEAEKVSATTPPTLGVNYFGNTYDFSDPADNSIGISNDGNLVSAHNTRIHMYNSQGTQQSATSLGSFISGSGQPTNFTFDPKVSYDFNEDRFVVVFLNGASSNGSTIIVCFSETNNPTGNWNVYGINGNLSVNGSPLGVWCDFPQIGLNTEELFVTGNLFTNQSASLGAAIWQINKDDGYAGNALTIKSHYLPDNFSVHPVEGAGSLYGPHMYFIESDLGGSNQITLHRMTNSQANNGVLDNAIGFTMPTSYASPPDADQKGSSNNLATNDCRVQNSYFANNRIEFTINTGFSGRSAIFYGTGIISPFLLSFSSFNGQVISPASDLFCCYGSVGYGGMNLDGTNRTYVAFNYCGPNDFPGCGAVYVDSAGVSPMLTVRTGVAAVNSAQQRWGDYADCQGRNNGLDGEAWMVGTFGNSANVQRTFIAQLFPPQPVAVTPAQTQGLSMDVYPNPTTDRVVFDFPVQEAGTYKVVVRDLQGRTVHTVIQDWLRQGEGRASFTTTALSAGTYLVSVENENGILFKDKFVVNK
jgi:Secretion system C-terminal sorting domain